MAYKITPIEALDDLLKCDVKYLRKNPKILKILLTSGFDGYENITLGQMAKFYIDAFPNKTKGHVQIIDAANPKHILAEYKINYKPGTKPLLHIIKGGKE